MTMGVTDNDAGFSACASPLDGAIAGFESARSRKLHAMHEPGHIYRRNPRGTYVSSTGGRQQRVSWS